MFRRRNDTLRDREHVQRIMYSLRCIVETMQEVIKESDIRNGSFNANILILCNKLRQAVTILYGNNFQTKHQKASILDSIFLTQDESDLKIQVRVCV